MSDRVDICIEICASCFETAMPVVFDSLVVTRATQYHKTVAVSLMHALTPHFLLPWVFALRSSNRVTCQDYLARPLPWVRVYTPLFSAKPPSCPQPAPFLPAAFCCVASNVPPQDTNLNKNLLPGFQPEVLALRSSRGDTVLYMPSGVHQTETLRANNG